MPDFNPTQPDPGSSSASSEIPQFATAEFTHSATPDRCRICSSLLSGEYYRVNGQMACAICARQASEGQPSDSHTAFARGVLFGFGGAILGLILFAAVAIATGWTIGYVSLAVGWLVGTAIMKGSNGIGGRRYQIAAVLLTYFAISVAAIPIFLNYRHNHPRKVATAQGETAPADGRSSPGSTTLAPHPRPKMGFVTALAMLIAIGLASPFLALAEPFQGLIGLFILFIGLRIAWTITRPRPLAVAGPYSLAAV